MKAIESTRYQSGTPHRQDCGLTMRINKYCVVNIAVRYQTCHRRHRRHRHTATTAERHRCSASAQDASKTDCVEDVGVICPSIASPNPASCARYDCLCLWQIYVMFVLLVLLQNSIVYCLGVVLHSVSI